jgi:hypothetical protein
MTAAARRAARDAFVGLLGEPMVQGKVYRGVPASDTDREERVFVVRSGERDAVGKPLRHTCLEYKRMTGRLPDRRGCHSPGGFAWGYPGSGPSELARMLLRDVLGQRVTGTVYQAFKISFTARFPSDQPWSLSEAEIRAWVADAPWRDEWLVGQERLLRPSEGGPPVTATELFGELWEKW